MVCVVSPKNIVPERGEGSGANRRRPGPTTQPIGNSITTTPGNSTLVLVRLMMKAEGRRRESLLLRHVRTIWNHVRRCRRIRPRRRRRQPTAATTTISVLPLVGYASLLPHT